MNKGFSLVELIVVIAIMAILVGVAVPVYTGYIKEANEAKDIQLIDSVNHACEIVAIEYSDASFDFTAGNDNKSFTLTVADAEAQDRLEEILGVTFTDNAYTWTLATEFGTDVVCPTDINVAP